MLSAWWTARLPYFLAEAHIIDTFEDVLDDHVFIAARRWHPAAAWQGRLCNGFLAVDLDWACFPRFLRSTRQWRSGQEEWLPGGLGGVSGLMSGKQ